MLNLLHDIFHNPGEYSTVLLFLAIVLGLWLVLCTVGWLSVLTARPRRQFWCGWVALGFGLIGLLAQIPFSAEGDGYHLRIDFRWLFIVPLLLGATGVVFHWRTKNRSLPKQA